MLSRPAERPTVLVSSGWSVSTNFRSAGDGPVHGLGTRHAIGSVSAFSVPAGTASMLAPPVTASRSAGESVFIVRFVLIVFLFSQATFSSRSKRGAHRAAGELRAVRAARIDFDD